MQISNWCRRYRLLLLVFYAPTDTHTRPRCTYFLWHSIRLLLFVWFKFVHIADALENTKASSLSFNNKKSAKKPIHCAISVAHKRLVIMWLQNKKKFFFLFIYVYVCEHIRTTWEYLEPTGWENLHTWFLFFTISLAKWGFPVQGSFLPFNLRFRRRPCRWLILLLLGWLLK